MLLSTTAYHANTLTNYLSRRGLHWRLRCLQMKVPAATTFLQIFEIRTEHDDRARQRIAGALSAPAAWSASAANM
ncbi:unnamed protein product [Ectocarpus sp. 12 AP-2014]